MLLSSPRRRLSFTLVSVSFLILSGAGAARFAAAAGAPASIALTPGSAIIEVGMGQEYTALLLDDQFSEAAIEAGSQIGFSVETASLATVTPSASNPHLATVTGAAIGTTKVHAFYIRNGAQTTITTDADLMVVAAGPGSDCTTTLCGAACVNTQTDIGNCGACGHVCSSTQACAAGVCGAAPLCAAPQTLCGADCVSLNSHHNHCGACDIACNEHSKCSAGLCVRDASTGCSLTPEPTGAPLGATLGLLALGALVAARRRRR